MVELHDRTGPSPLRTHSGRQKLVHRARLLEMKRRHLRKCKQRPQSSPDRVRASVERSRTVPKMSPPVNGTYLPGSHLNRRFGEFLVPPSTRLLLVPGGKAPLVERVDTPPLGKGWWPERLVLGKVCCPHRQRLYRNSGSATLLRDTRVHWRGDVWTQLEILFS